MTWHVETCEVCGHSGHKTDPVYEIAMFAEYADKMMCSSCRVDQRLSDGDFA